MEGNGLIRAHSEKVELRHNIFAEEEKAEEPVDPNLRGQKGPAQAPGPEHFLFQDEDGNPVNLAELQDFKGDLNDPEAVEAALAEQMRILHEM